MGGGTFGRLLVAETQEVPLQNIENRSPHLPPFLCKMTFSPFPVKFQCMMILIGV